VKQFKDPTATLKAMEQSEDMAKKKSLCDYTYFESVWPLLSCLSTHQTFISEDHKINWTAE